MPSSGSADSSLSPPLGFISIDVLLHRPPGDPFNEETWPFPLIRERAEHSPVSMVVSSDAYDSGFVDRFVDAGQRLAERGAVGIITSCGFLAMAQPELAARLPIPIMTSALLQIPSILALLPPSSSVGILTFDGTRLGPAHLRRLGIPPSRCHIAGPPALGPLQSHVLLGAEYVHAEIAAELVAAARGLVAEHAGVAVLCLECTQMPPFAEAIRGAVRIPVYDVYTAGCWFYSALVSTRPRRWGAVTADSIDTRV